MKRPETYGLLAEFEHSRDLLSAVRRVRKAGYRKVEAYTPFPVEGLAEALGFHRTWIPELVLAGGLLGGLAGYALQYYVSVVAYPLNVGGRPPHSWPSFVPVTFETTILLAALAAVIGMFVLNKLPKPYHPLFHVPAFDRATRDRFFLAIQATDPAWDPEGTRRALEETKPVAIHEVPS